MTVLELKMALSSIDKDYNTRLMNIILIYSKGSLTIPELAKAITQIEKELPKHKKNNFSYSAMQECLEKFNSLQQLRECVEDLSLFCLSQIEKSQRGLEVIARQYRIKQGLELLSSGILRFQALLDYLFSVAILRINDEAFKQIIFNEFNNIENFFPLETFNAKKVNSNDFKVL